MLAPPPPPFPVDSKNYSPTFRQATSTACLPLLCPPFKLVTPPLCYRLSITLTNNQATVAIAVGLV